MIRWTKNKINGFCTSKCKKFLIKRKARRMGNLLRDRLADKAPSHVVKMSLWSRFWFRVFSKIEYWTR